MYGKLINGSLVRLKMPIRTGEEDIFTNDENIIKSGGYKDVILTERPGETYIPHWEETDTQITQVWEVNQEEATV